MMPHVHGVARSMMRPSNQAGYDPNSTVAYFLRDDRSRLCGIMGVHVDDTAVGGCGPVFEKAITQLKSRFPYRKWRMQVGEFCGAFYRQDSNTKATISMSQQTFAESLRYASIPKGTDNCKLLTESQKRVLRAWVASTGCPEKKGRNVRSD